MAFDESQLESVSPSEIEQGNVIRIPPPHYDHTWGDVLGDVLETPIRYAQGDDCTYHPDGVIHESDFYHFKCRFQAKSGQTPGEETICIPTHIRHDREVVENFVQRMVSPEE
jgi:hypothetical protein